MRMGVKIEIYLYIKVGYHIDILAYWMRKSKKWILIAYTAYIRHLCLLSSDKCKPSIIILPCILISIEDSIGSIHSLTTRYSSQMQNNIAKTIYVFLGRSPIRTSYLSTGLDHDISIRVTIGSISPIFWKCEKPRKWRTVESRIVDRCLKVSSIRKLVATGTWSNRPSPVLGFILSLERESLIYTIIGNEGCILISCEKPSGFLRWTFCLGHSITPSPDLTTNDDIWAITSRISKGMCKWKEWCQCECEKEKFSHKEGK